MWLFMIIKKTYEPMFQNEFNTIYCECFVNTFYSFSFSEKKMCSFSIIKKFIGTQS